MDITRDTTISEAAPFLKEEHIQQLLDDERVPTVMGVSVIGMTVGEFLEALEPEYPIKKFFWDPDGNLLEAIGKIKSFRDQMDGIQKVLKMNEIQLSPEERSAQSGVVFPSFGESLLCECVEWFNLHSIDEAENIPLSNYLVMKRKKSAEALFERNLNKIYTQKAKQNSK